MSAGFELGSGSSGTVTVNLVITRATTTPPTTTPPTTTTVAHPHGPLPYTGAPVALEMLGSFGLLAAGVAAVVAGRLGRLRVAAVRHPRLQR